VRRVTLASLALSLGSAGLLAVALPADGGVAPPPSSAGPSRSAAALLPARVRVGGVEVGGLTPAKAAAAIRLAFSAPLPLVLDGRRLSVSPYRLGARAYVEGAVARALRSRPGSRVPLVVAVRGALVHAYVDQLARRLERRPVEARVILRDLRPRVVGGTSGFALRHWQAVRLIVRALREGRRDAIELPVRVLRPRLAAEEVGAVIVIRRRSKRLFYYEGERLVRVFTVATGRPEYPTPLGSFHIAVKWRNPWWYPPPSPWAQGLEPVPPGPGNPLGTRWMGLSVPAVGIHGTPDAASLGYSASHGCIRMAIPSAEWLFERVEVGTPVFIVDR
jgi:lipoprotein-anchoring transpeptidase ErfK/SrfK